MSTPFNPYAAPKARIVERTRASRLRIEGKSLVAPLGASLPAVCVLTGAVLHGSGTRHSKKLTWSSPWVALLLLVNVIVMLIVYYARRRSTLVSYSMLPALHRDRARRPWIATGIFFGGLAVVYGGVATGAGGLIGLGSMSAIVGLFLLPTWARGLWAQRIDDANVHIRGINPLAMRAIIDAAAEEEANTPDWRDQMFPVDP